MASLNKVMLIGNLTRDPELRYIPDGTAVADLGLAVNRNYASREGERKTETCFVDVVVWRKTAESCKEYLQKGSPIFVEGRLQLDTWENNQGEKRSKMRVVAERVQFLSSSQKSRSDMGSGVADAANFQGAQPQPADESKSNDDMPF